MSQATPAANVSQLTDNCPAGLWGENAGVVLSRVLINFLFPIVQNTCVVLNACGSNRKTFYPITGSLYCCWPHLTGEKVGTDTLSCGCAQTQLISDRIGI